MQDDYEELPPRPRRRLLGAGANHVALALLGVLLLAGGFIGGVLVEKGQSAGSSSSGASGGGLAARLGALRAAGGSAGAASGTGTSGAAGGGLARRLGAGGATIGEVAYVSGHTLYVTDFEGATVKVDASPASAITKTVKADLHGIHPGETVVVRGARGKNGSIAAESIAVNAAGLGGGALGGLFGGGAGRFAGGGEGRAAGGGKGGSGAALFGE